MTGFESTVVKNSWSWNFLQAGNGIVDRKMACFPADGELGYLMRNFQRDGKVDDLKRCYQTNGKKEYLRMSFLRAGKVDNLRRSFQKDGSPNMNIA